MIPGRHLMVGGGDTRRVLQPLQIADLPALGERDDHARRPGPGRAPRAVQVILGVGRRIVLYDQVDVIDVDAAGGYIGSDQDARVPGSERVKGPLTLTLVAVTVDGAGADPGSDQLVGEAVGAVLGPNEEKRPPRAAGDLRRDGHLVLRAEDQHAVLGRAAVHRGRDGVQRGIAGVRGH